MSWPTLALGEVADVNWGDTSVTKSSYTKTGQLAFSASGPDGFLPYADYDREAIVLSAIGARCGKTWFASGKWSCIKNTIRYWSVDDRLDNRYLFWVTHREDFFPKRGAAQPFITIGDARKVPLQLPPLDEQRRIAAILDKAEALRCKRKRALHLLDGLTQAIFLEMFGDPFSNSLHLPVRPLSDFLMFLTSGSRGWAKYYAEKGSLFIRIGNVKSGILDVSDAIYVNAPRNAEAKRTKVEAGDLLISITADLGRVAVVPTELHAKAHINQHLALARLNGVEPEYVAASLTSSGGVRQFDALNRQGVKAGLNFDDIRGLNLLVPSLDEQKQYVQAIEKVRDQSKHLFRSVQTVDTLFSSLQSRAFSGQL